MRLSLIVPVYNAPADVSICLESLQPELREDGLELIVINDASQAHTTDLLRDFCKTVQPHATSIVRLIEHDENKGYLQSVNEGIALAQAPVIVLLNSDTAIPRRFVERVLACFAFDPAIGLASPVASHCGLFSIPMKPGLTGKDVEVMDNCLRHLPPTYPTVIFPDGFCFCMRRTLLEAIGNFDERYAPGYFEESDLAMRAFNAGWRTVLIDNMYVYHKAQASFGSERNKALVQRNERLFNEQWGEQFQQLRQRYPREEHKGRLYAHIYSPLERIWRKTVRFLAQAIPIRSVRQRIRRAYN